MLFLLFHIGADRYALAARDVSEVLPLVALKQVPRAPRGIAGLLNYRGQSVPVLDVSLLATGQPAAQRVSTRVLVTHAQVPGPAGGTEEKWFGLLVERATETIAKEPGDFVPAGVAPAGARYLGPVAPDPRGFIQRIEFDVLLNDELRAALSLLETKEVAP